MCELRVVTSLRTSLKHFLIHKAFEEYKIILQKNECEMVQ